jgi:DNA-binding MarR family transcriptional regulator
MTHRPPGALAGNVGFLLSRLGARVRQAFADDLAAHGVRPAQYGLLAVLEEQGSAPQQLLGDAMSISRSNMVALVDELEARALVVRRPDPGDRRRHAVQLTDEGRRLVPLLHEVAREHTRRLLEPLSEPERAQLADLLSRLLAAR